MGGACGVIIRKADGTVLPIESHTSVLSSLVMGLPFLRGDEELAIADFCKEFNESRKDWLENKDTKDFKLPGSHQYGDHDQKIPSGYGLVVFDFQARKIHSMQGYGYVFGEFVGRLGFSGSKKMKEMLSTAIAEKLVKVINPDTNKIYTLEEYFGSNDVSVASIESYLEKKLSPVTAILNNMGLKGKSKCPADEIENGFSQNSFIPANNLGMTMIEYEESLVGIIKLYEILKMDGFVFTESEASLWADFAEDYLDFVEYETEEEDGLTRKDLTPMFVANASIAPSVK